MKTYSLRSSGFYPDTVFSTLEEARNAAHIFAEQASKNITIVEQDGESRQDVEKVTFHECFIDDSF